jgi:hypothetical protein
VIDFGGQLKLVKKNSLTMWSSTVSFDELFDVIHEAHITIGHRGIHNTVKAIKKKYVNITEKQVKLFISGSDKCKQKRAKPKHSSN